MLFEICAQGVADGCLHRSYNFVIAEFGFGLPLELRLHDFHRDYGCQTFAEVIAGNLDFALFQELVVFSIFLEGGGQSAAEPGQVCATLDGVDVVYKRIDVFVESAVIGQRNLNGDALPLGVEVYDIVNQRLFVRVDILYEFAESVGRIEHFAAGVAFAVGCAAVGEGQRYPCVEECEVAQTVGEGLVVIDGDGEDCRIRLECD